MADRTPQAERATALGLYRFFRDGGYVLGALLAGVGPGGLAWAMGGAGAGLLLLAAWATRSGALLGRQGAP